MTNGTGPGFHGDPEEERFQALAESFLERHRQGERPLIEEYAEKTPELAERIRAQFPAMLLVEGLREKNDREDGSSAMPTPAPPGSTTAAWVGTFGESKTKSLSGGSEATQTKTEPWIPKRLGEYRILREVGRGGMGVVFEAEQEPLRRHVALKVLPAHFMMDPRRLERFQREAQAAAKLQHPNIISVHALGEDQGVPFYTMQFIEGRSLQEVLPEVKRLRSATDGGAPKDDENRADKLSSSVALRLLTGDLSPCPERSAAAAVQKKKPSATERSCSTYFESVARVGLEVAQALSYAHGQGILHRDIKPSNIILDAQGHSWVADFGLAKALELDDLTQSGELVGTLRYMAPERFNGISDPRSDVYSLGMTLYELLILQPAFEETDKQQLLRKVLDEEPSRPCKIDPALSPALEAIVLKAMAKDLGERYQSADEMVGDLRSFLAGQEVKAKLLPGQRQRRPWSRVKAVLVGAVVLASLLAATVGVSVRLRRRPFEAVTLDVGTAPQQVIAGDLNGDRMLDLITANISSNDVSVIINRGGGSFASAIAVPAGRGPRSVTTGDIDGDGRLDLVTGSVFSKNVLVHLINGQSNVSKVVDLPMRDRVLSVAAGDLDNDGKADLAVVWGEKSLCVLRNKGEVEFDEPTAYETGQIPNFVGTADLDGDGYLDIVITCANETSAHVSVFWNQRNAKFEGAFHLPGAPSASGFCAVDLDGNGMLDLVGGARSDKGKVVEEGWLARNKGQRNFEPAEALPLGGPIEALAAADFDLDGDNDLAAVGGENSVIILHNNGAGVLERAAVLTAHAGPDFVSAADLDGDGYPDLAVSNARSNDLTVFFNHGSGFSAK